MGYDLQKSAKKQAKVMAKLMKARAKAEKKRVKTEGKVLDGGAAVSALGSSVERVGSGKKEKPSPALRFAEGVKGLLYLVTSASLVLAVVLQERGMWLELSEIVENLMLLRAGQFVLIIIALALFIYGLKQIRLVK